SASDASIDRGAAQPRDHLARIDFVRRHLIVAAAIAAHRREEVAATDRAALRDDLLRDMGAGAGDEFIGPDREAVRLARRVGHGRCRKPRIMAERLAIELSRGAGGFLRLALIGGDDDVAADRELVGTMRMPAALCLVAIGIEYLVDALGRVKAGAELGAAPRRLARGLGADDRRPARRRRKLQRPGRDAQRGEIPILAVMRHHRIGEYLVENLDRLGVAGVRLLDRQPDLRHLLRNAARRADLEPAAGELVQHADLLADAPGLPIGQHDAHDAEPQPVRYRREMGDEQVRRRAEAETEMMLAEENALEAEFLGAAPQIEMPAIALGGLGGAGVSAAHRRAEQLENPRLDHRRAAAPTPRLNP